MSNLQRLVGIVLRHLPEHRRPQVALRRAGQAQCPRERFVGPLRDVGVRHAIGITRQIRTRQAFDPARRFARILARPLCRDQLGQPARYDPSLTFSEADSQARIALGDRGDDRLHQFRSLPFGRQVGNFAERTLGILRGPRVDHGIEIRESLGGIRHLFRALPRLVRRDGGQRGEQMRRRFAIAFERLPERASDVELRVTQQQSLESVATFDRIRERARSGDHRRELFAVGMMG